MTEREKEFKLAALTELVDRYKTTGSLEPEKARLALEHAAALRQDAWPHKKTLLKIVEDVLGLPLDS